MVTKIKQFHKKDSSGQCSINNRIHELKTVTFPKWRKNKNTSVHCIGKIEKLCLSTFFALMLTTRDLDKSIVSQTLGGVLKESQHRPIAVITSIFVDY